MIIVIIINTYADTMISHYQYFVIIIAMMMMHLCVVVYKPCISIILWDIKSCIHSNKSATIANVLFGIQLEVTELRDFIFAVVVVVVAHRSSKEIKIYIHRMDERACRLKLKWIKLANNE